jgi:hypothetical protein
MSKRSAILVCGSFGACKAALWGATSVVAGCTDGALKRASLAKHAAGAKAEGGGFALGDVGGSSGGEGLANGWIDGAITRTDAE